MRIGIPKRRGYSVRFAFLSFAGFGVATIPATLTLQGQSARADAATCAKPCIFPPLTTFFRLMAMLSQALAASTPVKFGNSGAICALRHDYGDALAVGSIRHLRC